MTLPWWAGVPRAEATLACGESQHRLVWEDGTLTAIDHDDPEGERALAALGGEPLACIAVLNAWRDHAEDPDVLLFGSRGAADTFALPAEGPGQGVPLRLPRRPSAGSTLTTMRIVAGGRSGGAVGFGAPGGPSREDDLAALLALGGGIGRRLDATVAAHWCDRLLTPDGETDRVNARLQAALYGRVLAGLMAWLGQGDLALTMEMAPAGTMPKLQRGEDGVIAAVLPFGWLLEVWARGLEVVWGRFCLAATTQDGRRWELLTVGPDFSGPATLTVTLPD